MQKKEDLVDRVLVKHQDKVNDSCQNRHVGKTVGKTVWSVGKFP